MIILNRNNRTPSCGCNRDNNRINGRNDTNELSLAMAYVPNQPFDGLYSPNEALERGTLFRGLYKPYTGSPRGCGR